MIKHISESESTAASKKIYKLADTLNSTIFGQKNLIENVIIGLLARGHILLEGLPGLGKTELVKSLAKCIQLDHKRIQFTPDLLPGDITGNPVLQENEGKREFVFQKGPIFGNLILADEINRASPKTQSAMLEAMQEQHVTVMGEVHQIADPFFVLATQNPIELEGTYPLPEAQLDRFLFKLNVYRNDVSTLEKIVNEREMGIEPNIDSIMNKNDILELIALVHRVYLPDVVANYIARIVDATHEKDPNSSLIKFGASPRAALGLAAGAKARALLNGRINASFEDVKALAKPVLQHRIILDYRAKLDGKTTSMIVDSILKKIPVNQQGIPATIKDVN